MSIRIALKTKILIFILFLTTINYTFAAGQSNGLKIIHTSIKYDDEFDKLLPYVIDGWDLKHEFSEINQYSKIVNIGATVKIILLNNSDVEKKIDGILIEDVDIVKQILPIHSERGGIKGANYYYNKQEITSDDIKNTLNSCGKPIWYQIRPNPISPNNFSEIVIRLRTKPQKSILSIVLKFDESVSEKIELKTDSNEKFSIASISFNNDISRVYFYLRKNDKSDFVLKNISINSKEIPLSEIPCIKSSQGFLPVSVKLNKKLDYGSYICITAETISGDKTAATIRCRDNFFALGMWGYRLKGNSREERAKDTAQTLKEYLFNTLMGMAADNGNYYESPEGMKWLEEINMKFMVRDPAHQNIRNPISYARFLFDEPDANDHFMEAFDPNNRIGSLAQGVSALQEKWTSVDNRTLTLLNINETFKPENWWVYGQLADILSIDPYYQGHLYDAYKKHPGWMSKYCHPFLVFASADIARHACEPKPLHVILNAVSYRKDDEFFRYGTPEEKRIEFYYALAAGAKGISYWWFTPYGEYMGCGADDSAAKAMMNEMKKLNAEALVVSPILATSYPAEYGGTLYDLFFSTNPRWVFSRTLFAGNNTALIIMVNRDHFSDMNGTKFVGIPNVRCYFKNPAWLKPEEIIRLNSLNPEKIPFLSEPQGTSEITKFEFKDMGLTEMLLISSDTNLKDELTSKCLEIKKLL